MVGYCNQLLHNDCFVKPLISLGSSFLKFTLCGYFYFHSAKHSWSALNTCRAAFVHVCVRACMRVTLTIMAWGHSLVSIFKLFLSLPLPFFHVCITGIPLTLAFTLATHVHNVIITLLLLYIHLYLLLSLFPLIVLVLLSGFNV